MQLALSTHWNASRHASGESLVQEILEAGIRRLELGYDLRLELASGVRRMVEARAVRVDSIHSFCPIPLGVPAGHPELFTLASPDPRVRQSAVHHLTQNIRFAADIGARAVVVHSGYVDIRRHTRDLISLHESGLMGSERYEKDKMKLVIQRDSKARAHLDFLCAGLDALLPELERCGVSLGLENLPSWESIPTEPEMDELARRYNSPFIRYWHDFGHGYVREALGLTSHRRWFEKLAPWTLGMHIHDAASPSRDHLMPPAGKINFAAFKPFLRSDMIAVLEPAPGTPVAAITEAARTIREIWEIPENQGD